MCDFPVSSFKVQSMCVVSFDVMQHCIINGNGMAFWSLHTCEGFKKKIIICHHNNLEEVATFCACLSCKIYSCKTIFQEEVSTPTFLLYQLKMFLGSHKIQMQIFNVHALIWSDFKT